MIDFVMFSKILLILLILSGQGSLIRTSPRPILSTYKGHGRFFGRHKKIMKAKATVQPRQTGMILYNLSQQRIIKTHNPTVKFIPASLTKIMTLYAAAHMIETGKASLNDYITVSRTAASQIPSKLGLPPGSKIKLSDAISAMMVFSANDMAYAIAEHLFGADGIEKALNSYARSLNMEDTYFGNPTGLHNKQQVSTPRDMLRLTVALRRFYPQYMKYSNCRCFTYNNSKRAGTNKLIGRIQGVQGLKTGFLNSSGWHIITYSNIAGQEFICLCVGHGSSREREEAATKLIQGYNRELFAQKNENDDKNTDSESLCFAINQAMEQKLARTRPNAHKQNRKMSPIPPANKTKPKLKKALVQNKASASRTSVSTRVSKANISKAGAYKNTKTSPKKNITPKKRNHNQHEHFIKNII